MRNDTLFAIPFTRDRYISDCLTEMSRAEPPVDGWTVVVSADARSDFADEHDGVRGRRRARKGGGRVDFAAQSARRESRIRSRRGVTPGRSSLAGQCQARIAIGWRSWVASPTPNPTWPPTRTREVVTVAATLAGFDVRVALPRSGTPRGGRAKIRFDEGERNTVLLGASDNNEINRDVFKRERMHRGYRAFRECRGRKG